MIIVILPISGGYIVNQLAAVDILLKHKLKPDITLGASGGAITSSLMISANYRQNNFRRIISNITSEHFIKEWTPVMNSIIGFFQGSIYKHPDEYIPMTEVNTSTRILQETESWVQTYDKKSKKTHVYCTKREGESILTIKPKWAKSSHVKGPLYLNGNVVKYANVLKASSSIPALLPPMLIDDGKQVDGGIVYPSPLYPLMDSIKSLSKKEKLDIIYISGYNSYLDTEEDKGDTILDTFTETISNILNGYVVQDIHNCCNLISNEGKYIEEEMTIEEYLDRKDDWSRSFLEVYPDSHYKVNITSLPPGVLLEKTLDRIPNIRSVVRYIE